MNSVRDLFWIKYCCITHDEISHTLYSFLLNCYNSVFFLNIIDLMESIQVDANVSRLLTF